MIENGERRRNANARWRTPIGLYRTAYQIRGTGDSAGRLRFRSLWRLATAENRTDARAMIPRIRCGEAWRETPCDGRIRQAKRSPCGHGGWVGESSERGRRRFAIRQPSPCAVVCTDWSRLRSGCSQSACLAAFARRRCVLPETASFRSRKRRGARSRRPCTNERRFWDRTAIFRRVARPFLF